MKAIVTGGAGFIGSHIAKKLIELGHDVIIIDDLSSGYEKNLPEQCTFIKADVVDTELYEKWLYKSDVIFHNAASKKNICLRDPARDLEVNGLGTLKLLQMARHLGIPKFIHASTGSVYGEADGVMSEHTLTDPVSYYGVSKLAGERYVQLFHRLYGMNTTIIRYFHVYGDNQENDPDLGGVVAVFRRQIDEGGPITIHGDGSQERVFTSVLDVVDANLRAWNYTRSEGKVYNCCSKEPVTVLALAHKLMAKYGRVDVVFREPLVGDIHTFLVDNGAIRDDLEMEFTPFSKGINEL